MGVDLMQAEGVSFDQLNRLNLHFQAVGFLFGSLDVRKLCHINSKSVVGFQPTEDVLSK